MIPSVAPWNDRTVPKLSSIHKEKLRFHELYPRMPTIYRLLSLSHVHVSLSKNIFVTFVSIAYEVTFIYLFFPIPSIGEIRG